MRVAHWLESADEKGGIFTDANGTADQGGQLQILRRYGSLSDQRRSKGGAAWGTRGRWCTLTGTNPDKHVVTIAIIDNPGNPGYPTYWHARGYGLFAANPLGRRSSILSSLHSTTRSRKVRRQRSAIGVILFSGAAGPEEMNKEADAFAAEYK